MKKIIQNISIITWKVKKRKGVLTASFIVFGEISNFSVLSDFFGLQSLYICITN